MKGVIDAGNTRVKCAIFSSGKELIQKELFQSIDEAIQWLLSKNITSSIYSSSSGLDVGNYSDKISIYKHSPDSKIPFINLYKTPQTLGTDRIAAMSAVSALYPSENTLVLDAGTCLTVDFLDAGNNYRGGMISPGFEMRLKAMHTFTGKLPLISTANDFKIPGTNTSDAIGAGAFQGMRLEMEGYMRFYSKLFPDLKVVICGGDAMRFEFSGEFRIFAAPDLILRGLLEILLLNEV